MYTIENTTQSTEILIIEHPYTQMVSPKATETS